MADQNSVIKNERMSPENVSLEQRFDIQKNAETQVSAKEEVRLEHAQETAVAQNENVYAHILAQVQSQQPDDHASIMQDASAMHQIADRESQITHLMDIAMAKGVVHAVKVAQQMEDYYVLDQLHDRMRAEEFHQALIAKGLIE